MKINKIHIVSFGGLKNCELILDEYFNLIKGPNEFGKTTLFAFIRAMLFGLKGNRRTIRDDYDRYLPIDNPTDFRGEMYVELAGIEYLIDRNFHRTARYTKITETDTGKELTEAEWQAKLIPMDYETFTNTCYIGADTTKPGKSFMDTLQERIIGMAQSNSDDIFVHGSVDLLNERQKLYRRQLRDLPELPEKDLYDEKIDLETQIDTIERAVSADRADRRDRKLYRFLPALILVFGAVLTGLQFVAPRHMQGIFFYGGLAFILAGIGFGLYRAGRYMVGRTQRRNDDIMYDHLQHLKRLQRDNAASFLRHREIAARRKVIQENIDAIELAKREIHAIAKKIYATNTNELNRRLSDIFTDITDNAYEGVFVNEDMHIYALKEGTLYAMHHLSKGTLEQLYLSLRIVALDLLYKSLHLPLIIDDGFVHYDFQRYKNTMELLEKMDRQVIVFNLSKSVF